MKVSIIVAAAENNVIGRDNKLIWKLSDDMKHFKSLTMGNAVIMGRKTYESLGRPLPGRKNIVVTRDTDFSAEGFTVVNSTQEALKAAEDHDDAFIIGGGELYKEFWNKADVLFLTRVHTNVVGDTFIPDVNEYWVEVKRESHAADEKNECGFTIITYLKR